jgi:hypothetical protein
MSVIPGNVGLQGVHAFHTRRHQIGHAYFPLYGKKYLYHTLDRTT